MDPTPPPAPTRAHRRLWPLLIALPLLVIVLLAGALGTAWWMVSSEAGTAWLLRRIPGLQVTGTKGALLGDFDVARLETPLPRGGSLVVEGLAWRGLRVQSTGSDPALRIVIDRLAATRVDIRPGAPSPEPTTAPTELAVPIALQVDALQVQALYATPLGDTPLRDLSARLQLGADAGRQHRVDALVLAFGKLRASGSATLGSQAPLPLQARLDLAQDGALVNALWSAALRAEGPLAAPQVQATLRAEPTRRSAAQSLALQATLRPFDAWPLGDLDATAQGLDLSAFVPDAPVTALAGEAHAKTAALDQPAQISIQLRNVAAGRWNDGRLPLQSLSVELRARPNDPNTLDVQALDAELGGAQQNAGRIKGSGRWAATGWRLDAVLEAIQPARLDARAAPMQLGGPVRLEGSAPGATAQTLELRADLNGQLADRGPARAVQLRIDAGAQRDAGGDRIELREALATASGARAQLAATARRAAAADSAWQLKGHATLAEFDPLPWWPGREDSPWRRGPHRLNAQGDFDLTLPHAAGNRTPSARDRLTALRGEATLAIAESRLAGVPLRGQVKLKSGSGGTGVAQLNADIEADGNALQANARLGLNTGSDDAWELALDAPALAKLVPLWRLLRPGAPDATLAGSLTANAKLAGRWPALSASGQAQANTLRVDTLTLQRGDASWNMGSGGSGGTGLDAPLQAQLDLQAATLGPAALERATLSLQGSARAHRLEARVESKARPPAWVDALQAAPTKAGPSVVQLQAQGALVESGGALAGWRGKVEQIDARATGSTMPWLRSRDITFELLGWDAAPLRATLQPGRAELPGAALRWDRIVWQDATANAPAELEAKAELEPVAVAPLLARLQPDFGWGGDLLVGGRLEVHSAPSFQADVVLERSRGDLTVTDEVGTQALGLSDLRLGLNVADGVWSFTQGLAGSTLGVAAGAFVARTTPQARWPAPETPVSGVLELQVANLGTWGTWVPAGWRLGGALRVSAGIGGTFGAPEYTGQMQGHSLSVRNFVQGVNVSDGEVAIALQGASARIERFTARGGAGTLQLDGGATLGATPQAQIKLTAQRFQLLGRVDRRIVASGQAQLQLDRDKLALDGSFKVDEGLIDFTRSDAPSLSDDVIVQRSARAEITRAAAEATPVSGGLVMPRTTLDLRVDLGEQLRLRGRGLDTGLRGELHLTSPGGRLAVNGTVRAVDGTYAAYGQKLEIDRGNLTFNGPAENPRLDIEATRPNLDVRVGVAVSGSAVNPRVRLFSEPELSDLDKLSWLVLGRASDGLGRTDTALLQRAALALLAGDGQGPTDQVTKAIGLDEVSLRQTDGDVRETVISLGKQLSRRWYVGYERSLNATAGSWQLIYRIAQRFTLRAQSGEDSSLDLIWTWRWN